MILTPDELAELELLMPEAAAKIRTAQEEALRSQTFVVPDDEEDPIVYEDQPVTGIVVENPEPNARDRDTEQSLVECPACSRGGTPRAGAPHVCGLPSPPQPERATWPGGYR